jgi:lipid A 3-O-deacylase
MRCIPILLVCLLLATQVGPQAMASHPPDEQTIFVVDIENDWFAGTDRYYTGGQRLTWVKPADHGPDWARRLATAIPFGRQDALVGVTLSIGQNAYTPAARLLVPPDPEDRPYAGWLYLTAGVDALTERRLDRLQLTVGVVGPASGVDRIQRAIHKVTGPAWPRGWDHQLRNEPTLMLNYERKWHALAGTVGHDWEADFAPHAGASVGTPFTFLNAGAMIRVGRDLPMDYGPPRIQPGPPGSGLFDSRPGMRGYAFAGVDARLIGHDLFLDGNTWRDSPSVDKKRWVGDLYLGIALAFEHVRISYVHVLRTREFRTQASRQRFGSLSISWIH